MYTFRFIVPVLLTILILTGFEKPAQAGVAKKAAGALVVSAALVALIVKFKGKELKEFYKKQQRWVRKELAMKLDHLEELKALQDREGQQYDSGPAIEKLKQEAEAFRKWNFIYRLF